MLFGKNNELKSAGLIVSQFGVILTAITQLTLFHNFIVNFVRLDSDLLTDQFSNDNIFYSNACLQFTPILLLK